MKPNKFTIIFMMKLSLVLAFSASIFAQEKGWHVAEKLEFKTSDGNEYCVQALQKDEFKD